MPATRSINWNTAAACSAGNASSSSSAVTSCDQTKNGMRASVTPGARARTMVVIIDTDDSVAEALTKTIPISHQVWPDVARIDSGGYDGPPRVGRAALDEEAGDHHHAAQRRRASSASALVRGSAMLPAPIMQRHQQRAEGAGRQRHHGQEDHHRAVHGDELVVELGQHDAAGRVGLAQHRRQPRRQRLARPRQLPPHQQHQQEARPAGRTGT